MAILISIRGNSGSGKTTVSESLQKRFGKNTMLLSQDVIRRNILYVNDGVDNEAEKLLIHLLKYGNENCEIVILEGILHSRWYKSLYEFAIKEYDYILSYYYDLPIEETFLRHETRKKASDFGEADMTRWFNSKDYLNFLDEKVLTKELKQEEVVENIIFDVNRLRI